MLRPRQVCSNYISKLRQACNSPGQTKWVEITQDFSSSSYFFNAAFILKGVALNSLRFLFDGQRINDDQTPKDVSLYLHIVNLIFGSPLTLHLKCSVTVFLPNTLQCTLLNHEHFNILSGISGDKPFSFPHKKQKNQNFLGSNQSVRLRWDMFQLFMHATHLLGLK